MQVWGDVRGECEGRAQRYRLQRSDVKLGEKVRGDEGKDKGVRERWLSMARGKVRRDEGKILIHQQQKRSSGENPLCGYVVVEVVVVVVVVCISC